MNDKKLYCDSCGYYGIGCQEVILHGQFFGIYCKNCRRIKFIKCADCNKNEHKDYAPAVKTGPQNTALICRKCLKNYIECQYCNCMVSAADMEKNVCKWCFPRLAVCPRCKNMALKETFQFTNMDGVKICNYCAQEAKRYIHQWGHVPCPQNFLKIGRDSDLYFGFELELETIKSKVYYPCIAQHIQELVGQHIIYCKFDRSIGTRVDGKTTGEQAFEIVSHPFTWNWWQRNADLFVPIFNLRAIGCRSYNTKTCGIHIHMSQKAFQEFQLAKFLTFIYDNPNFIRKFSLRQKVQIDRYASLSHGHKKTSGFARRKSTPHTKDPHHIAVSISNKGTIEVRIFRGTLSPAGFSKNIEFCHALFYYSASQPMSAMKDVPAFYRYVKERVKMYPNLCAFLDRKLKPKEGKNS